MWAAFFFIPFLKYPANPSTVGDPHAIIFPSSIYALFIVLSDLGAFGFFRLYKKMEHNFMPLLDMELYQSSVCSNATKS
jgi:hypothetical protein